jgi:hypothetical protein
MTVMFVGLMQPLGAPQWPDGPHAGLSWQVFNLTAFALSLLMVFKTNSSYARCATLGLERTRGHTSKCLTCVRRNI